MKKIYFVRHGESEANAAHIRCGVTDVLLTENGKKQAESIGNYLKDKRIKKVYSSYLKRAKETAKIIADIVNINEVEVFENLYEINYGSLDGVPTSNTEGLPPDFQDLLYKKDAFIQYPGGENTLGARKRFCDAVENLCKQDINDAIVIVSHGSVLRQLVTKYNFEDISSLKNCETIEAEFDGENINIIKRIIINN